MLEIVFKAMEVTCIKQVPFKQEAAEAYLPVWPLHVSEHKHICMRSRMWITR